MRLVSIDPGKRHVGWALFVDGVLGSCGLFRFEAWSELHSHVGSVLRPDVIVCEVPQVYVASKSKGDPNDLIDVALTSGVCLGLVGDATAVRPRDWKKTTDPDVVDARIRARMAAHPPFTLSLNDVPKSLQHNTVDAVGLGLWWIDKGGRR